MTALKVIEEISCSDLSQIFLATHLHFKFERSIRIIRRDQMHDEIV